MDELKTLSAYFYFFASIVLIVLLYAYVYHIYKSEKKGLRDYERYGRLALDDELHDELIEPNDKQKKESKKES